VADGRPRDAREAYDPARDLAVLLHEALRQGHWGPAAAGALRRLGEHLAPAGEFALASDIEARLRGMLAGPGRSRADLDEDAAAAATRLHEAAAEFRAEMAAAEPDLDGFVERTLSRAGLPEDPAAGRPGAT
jgi:hypothetical protein